MDTPGKQRGRETEEPVPASGQFRGAQSTARRESSSEGTSAKKLGQHAESFKRQGRRTDSSRPTFSLLEAPAESQSK
jgi:hypothetical protein